jgi:predicted transcriptional regulator
MGIMVGGVMQATGVLGIQAGELDAYQKLLEDHQRTSAEEFAPEVMRLRERFQRVIGLARCPGGGGWSR